MEQSPKIVVDKMLAAFSDGNVEAIVETVSEDTLWIYHGTQLIPKGEYKIGVCLGTACYVKGSQEILDKVEELLGISVGQTTSDRKFSIDATRCLGACGLAPVLTVNEDVYGKLNPDDVKEIIEKYR